MHTFKILSVLLTYPQQETLDALGEMAEIIERETHLSNVHKKAVQSLIDSYRGADLLDLQERYVALFDRGRFLSLHIFEHVHGESRDRGQAMIDLLELYRTHGFELSARELPDFIPLFLEFLTQLASREQALQLLRDAMPVLSLLGARLAERGSRFHVIFDALADIAGEPEDIADIRRQAAVEGEDESLVNMDAIWEEEAVSFMAAGEPCQTQTGTVNPITITPRDQILKSPRNRSL
ncbi:nitrate reductase molybdenum cofactor assembly chaperone [Methylomarinum sp. Ch1-1]|uniref:Nitrate reductase molybdenum cofactor assembly chaperone n=1 Tax=Methylomarinum roseum TaxID=3067653 RepID=A0AAU7NTZ2_9GAMM|nr:nitrate reductase molybdenum cofactor assembly chaperone [Methylomarinum sp. Ch1-1]MDP4519926.1 nitrate reductase molybdenum cofactor assembly chaperone [Methylomarinum sp. Ch1-1]